MSDLSPDLFKLAMRRLGAAVTIVATGSGGLKAGLTASAVTSLSATPPRLLACVNKDGTTFKTLQTSRVMSINILTIADKALAERFGGLDGTPEQDRFAAGRWVDTALGVVRLETALVSLICDVADIIDANSHGIVIGDIRDVFVPDRQSSTPPRDEALAYIDGQWSSFGTL